MQSENHLQGLGCFVRKGFVWGVECLFNCFPHSVPHRPTAASVLRTKTSPLVQMCSDRRGAGHRGDLQMSPRTWLSLYLSAVSCPAHFIIQFCYKEFQNHFLLQHWQLLPLLPVSNESFGTKPVKIGKGYATSDLGKQVATFRELKLSFSRD